MAKRDEQGIVEIFARIVVDHAQDAEPPARHQRAGDEIERPALVRSLRAHDRCRTAQDALAATAAPDQQALLVVDMPQVVKMSRPRARAKSTFRSIVIT